MAMTPLELQWVTSVDAENQFKCLGCDKILNKRSLMQHMVSHGLSKTMVQQWITRKDGAKVQNGSQQPQQLKAAIEQAAAAQADSAHELLDILLDDGENMGWDDEQKLPEPMDVDSDVDAIEKDRPEETPAPGSRGDEEELPEPMDVDSDMDAIEKERPEETPPPGSCDGGKAGTVVAAIPLKATPKTLPRPMGTPKEKGNLADLYNTHVKSIPKKATMQSCAKKPRSDKVISIEDDAPKKIMKHPVQAFFSQFVQKSSDPNARSSKQAAPVQEPRATEVRKLTAKAQQWIEQKHYKQMPTYTDVAPTWLFGVWRQVGIRQGVLTEDITSDCLRSHMRTTIKKTKKPARLNDLEIIHNIVSTSIPRDQEKHCV
jgi:hypothetical protein